MEMRFAFIFSARKKYPACHVGISLQPDKSEEEPLLEALLATTVFWSTYVFTPGPFWIALSTAARSTPVMVLFKQYVIFTCLSWGPQIFLTSLVVGGIAAWHPAVLTTLYFLGGAVILMLAYRTLSVTKKKLRIQFTWRQMALVSWSNPKAWISIPAGALSATYTQTGWLNALLFFIISTPLFFVGVFLWAYLGKLGAKAAADKFVYAATALLAGYGLYLLYQGFLRVGG